MLCDHAHRRTVSGEPADALGCVRDRRAVGARPRSHRVAAGGVEGSAALSATRSTGPHEPGRPPGRWVVTVVARLTWAIAPWWWRSRRRASYAGPEAGTGRHLAPAARGGRGAGPELHQARADHLVRRGPVPERARLGVQEVPRPGPGRAVRRRAGDHRGRPGRPFARGVRVDRRDRACGSVDRPGSCRPSAHRRAGRRQGSAARRRPPRAHRPEDDGVDRAAPRRPHPGAALANPPALVELFAETIVEELDFRLEAANMLDIATVLRDLGQDGYVVPRPHPRW